MKSKLTYVLVLSMLAGFVLLISFKEESPKKENISLRNGLNASPEFINAGNAIDNLKRKIKNNPKDIISKNQLGFAYLQQARIKGVHSDMNELAEKQFKEVLKADPENYHALVGKATVLLSEHHFSDAIPLGIKASKVNPHSPDAYGVLVDAYVETGKYDPAIIMADKMVSVKPDLRSYSRISYLREIHGDNKGAIEAMQMAVEAGYPGAEQTEWCRVQLGNLYLNEGDLYNALSCYEQSIYYRPSFAWAYGGKAKVEKANGRYEPAIQLLQQAQTLMNDFSFQKELTEIYRITGQQEKARLSGKKCLQLLGHSDDNHHHHDSHHHGHHGHNADNELAYAYLDSYNYLKALDHAKAEYDRRPENIEVNQTLAWVHYKLGNYELANKHINYALRLNSKNAILNFQAGLIKLKNGNVEEGKLLISLSETLNPYLSPLLKWELKRS